MALKGVGGEIRATITQYHIELHAYLRQLLLVTPYSLISNHSCIMPAGCGGVYLQAIHRCQPMDKRSAASAPCACVVPVWLGHQARAHSWGGRQGEER